MLAYDVIEFGNEKNSPNIKLKINSSFDEILSFIHSLEEEIGSTNPDFGKLKSLCFELVRRLPLPIQLLQNTFILRGRENINGEVFSKLQELSYNPIANRIGLGRFNLNGESVFYGAVPITSHNASGQLTTICESCKELFDSDSKHHLKYFTVGKWNILKPIKTVVLTFFENAKERSWHVGNLNPNYESFLSSICNAEDLRKCHKFYSFFSEYAAKKYDSGDNYLLTTAFFHALQQYYGSDIGILYSSSMTDNTGLNVAFSKDVLDSDHLAFEGAVMFKVMGSTNSHKSYMIAPCTDYAKIEIDERFRFKYIL